MSNVKKLMMTAAGGAGLNVEDVFSAYLYRGNGSSQTITNGIDLSTEGGMVWTKGRSAARGNNIWDSERSLNQVIMPDQGTGGTFTENSAIGVTALNTDGFTLGGNSYSEANIANTDYVSWTFAGRGDDADRGRGQIIDLRVQGEVQVPQTDVTLTATEEEPVALIRTRSGKVVGQYTRNLRKIQKPIIMLLMVSLMLIWVQLICQYLYYH